MMGTTTASGWLNEDEIILRRMRNFHRERVSAIHKNESHVRLNDPSRLILHLIPEDAARAPKSVAAADLKKASQTFRVLGDRNGSPYRNERFNVDGFLLYDGTNAVRGYAQFYRDGVYEGVMAEAVYQHDQENEKLRSIRENWCEEALISALTSYLPFAKALSVKTPFRMFVSLVGCEGARICTDRTFREFSEQAIDRDVVWLPETNVESFDIDPVKLLRPVCDVLWNAVGMERSFSYDEQGNRSTRQR